MSLTEAAVRDQLLENLSLLEPGLIPVQTEFHVSSNRGASGWVDILARDGTGMHVLIEVKVARKPTREAVHEVMKYAAIFVEQNGLGPEDVRLILAASDWHELGQSFSEVTSNWDYRCDGYYLSISSDGVVQGAERIEAFERAPVLNVCPEQLIYLFRDSRVRDRDSGRISDALLTLGAPDHLVMSMDHSSDSDQVLFPYCSYVALGVNAGEAAEAKNRRDDPWSRQLDILDRLLSAVPAQTAEQGSPATLLTMRAWQTRTVIRAGRFGGVIAWDDEQLQRRVTGEGAAVPTRYEAKSRPIDGARWERLQRSALTSVKSNPSWTRGLQACFAFSERVDPDGVVEVYVYDPEDLILTLQCANQGALDFVPWMRFELTSGIGHSFKAFGFLEWSGVVPLRHWDEILISYGGDVYTYMARKASGELASGNLNAMARLGLEYTTILEFDGSRGKLHWDKSGSMQVDRLVESPLHVGDLVRDSPGLSEWIDSRMANRVPMPRLRLRAPDIF